MSQYVQSGAVTICTKWCTITGEQTSVTKVVSPGSFQWIVKMVENQRTEKCAKILQCIAVTAVIYCRKVSYNRKIVVILMIVIDRGEYIQYAVHRKT